MKIRVGSKVIYRPGFGHGEPVEVSIESIQICDMYSKEGGREVQTAETDRSKGRLVLDMSDGHWAYGYQIKSVVNY